MKATRTIFVICVCCTSGCWNREPSASTVDAPRQNATEKPDASVSSGESRDSVSNGSLPTADEKKTAQRRLTIGDVAPPITVSSWMKGKGATTFLSGKTYVVEFWATWCAPCLEGMPHLSELQTQFGEEVLVLGITNEDEDTIKRFLARSSGEASAWDDVVTYAIGIDDGRNTFRSYMEKSGDIGIPKAFIVGPDGYIEWIGQPMRLDEPLAKVVRGEWDRVAARELYTKLLRTVILRREGHTAELEELQLEIAREQWNDASVLMDLAAAIASSPEPRDLELALRAAKRANRLTNSQDAIALRTLAWVHYEREELASAITWQKQATQARPGDSNLQAALEKYIADGEDSHQ